MILLIDNYDSFVHNLARHLRRLGQETLVIRNDQIDAAAISQLGPQALVLSPGPLAPQQAGCCLDAVRRLYRVIPILGVCLGHQVIAEAFGGRIVRAREPVHGRASMVQHNGQGIFAGLPNPFRAGRYHSLVLEPATMPSCFEATAWMDDEIIMAIQHRDLPVVGWQFHPESVLTQHGYELLWAFLRFSGIKTHADAPNTDNNVADRRLANHDWFQQNIDVTQ